MSNITYEMREKVFSRGEGPNHFSEGPSEGENEHPRPREGNLCY